ncbi:hypothetical protein TrRE_jg12914, partial [Triparma retinervis]
LKRLSVWLPTGICYAFFYCTRYNVAAGNVDSVRSELNFSASDFATVVTAGFWTYAVSAPMTGIVSDRMGGRFGLLVSAVGSGTCNLLLGVAFEKDGFLRSAGIVNDNNVYGIFVTLYSLNILFQGFGTAAVIKVNSGWYCPMERGVFSGIYNVLLTSGYYMALGGGPVIIQQLGWDSVFLLPGGGLLLCFALMFMTLKEAPGPEDLGGGGKGGMGGKVAKLGGSSLNLSAALEEEEEKRTKLLDDDALELGKSAATASTPLLPSGSSSASPGPPKATVGSLLRSPTFICYLIAIVNLCWVRDGLITWIYSFLESSRGVPLGPDTAAMIGGAITLGGFLGGVLCGLASDNLFGGNRSNPILLFSFFQVITLSLLYAACLRGAGDTVVAGLMFATAIFMLGNYTLLSYTIPTDLPFEIVATAGGVMTAAGYVASGLAGMAMGRLIEGYGYEGWFISLQVATFFGSLAIFVGSKFGTVSGTGGGGGG